MLVTTRLYSLYTQASNQLFGINNSTTESTELKQSNKCSFAPENADSLKDLIAEG